jgi:drug/metabolite transporter (DMT)-like permease
MIIPPLGYYIWYLIDAATEVDVQDSRLGLPAAVLSAAAFGSSGSFASSLIRAGWSPAAAVTTRILLAGVVLTIPAVISLRRRWHVLVTSRGRLLAYGVMSISGAQLCYFNAVQYLSVGVALLLEYLGTLLVVCWMWARHGQRPGRLTTIGAGLAVIGLVLVLDVTETGGLSVVGVLWGLGAAVGLATYFVLSAQVDRQLPPVAMAWAGMLVGGGGLLLAGLVGLAPLRASTSQVLLMHHRVSWLVPMLGLSVVAGALAYAAGITAARSLGARLSSFVGLSEVLFAVLLAWLLLGQLPRLIQLVGGLLIIAGVTAVRIEELRSDVTQRANKVPAAVA